MASGCETILFIIGTFKFNCYLDTVKVQYHFRAVAYTSTHLICSDTKGKKKNKFN